MTKRNATQEESGPLFTWSLRGRTYVHVPVPTTAPRGTDGLDEDRAISMTDEGGPPLSERAATKRPGDRIDMV
jgi:hypothetical protein